MNHGENPDHSGAFWAILGVVFGGLLLVGMFEFSARAGEAIEKAIKAPPTRKLHMGDKSYTRIVTDPETGCEYLTRHWEGITPRLNQYGQPICGKD